MRRAFAPPSLLLLLASPLVAHEPETWPTFAADVQPFLRTHCVECHGGRKTEADLNLARVAEQGLTDLALLRDVRDLLFLGEMPPEEQPAPSERERARVLEWADRTLAEGGHEPARITMRRLNRFEYENTIRDLLGVHFDASSWFPEDEVGNGFDNQGQVLALPDLLFEKFFEAAERIAGQAIAGDLPVDSLVLRSLPESMEGTTEGHHVGAELFSMSTNGAARIHPSLPRDGIYLLRVRVHGSQAGPDPARMELRANGQLLRRIDVTAVAEEPAVVEVHAELTAGEQLLDAAFINDYYAPEDPDPNNRDRNLYIHWIELEGPLDPPPASPFQQRLMEAVRDQPDRLGAALEIIATRAWRRPVTKQEVLRLSALARPDEPLSHSLSRGLTAILISPHFLFRVEPFPEDPPASQAAPLDPHHLATRLAYFLWSSLPDDDLFRAAREGELNDCDQRAAQVRRMLSDARSSALVDSFARQWLQLGQLLRSAPDPKRFPEFDEELREALCLETSLLFEAVLRDQRSVRTLLRSDFTFLNQRLARHYGIEGVVGPQMRRVPLADERRSGLLAHAGILTMTSEPTRTSAVKRGKWVLEVLLDQPPPPPPPDVTALEVSAPEVRGGTLRQRMELHRKHPDCASCHQKMDPIGFSLSNYDPIGRWRKLDNGRPIDAKGALPDGRSFDGPHELSEILLADSAFVFSLARHLAVYALGRGLSAAEKVGLEERLRPLGPDPTLTDLILCIVELDAFRTLPPRRLPA